MIVLERPQRIADALKNNLLTEKEKLFFVAAILVNYLFGTRSLIFQFGLYALIEFAFAVGGVWLCFRENSRGDNRQFIERFLCLQTAIAIRVYSVVFAIYYLLGFLWRVLEKSVYFP